MLKLFMLFLCIVTLENAFGDEEISISDQAYDALSQQEWIVAREKINLLDQKDPVTSLYWGIFYGNSNNAESNHVKATYYLEKSAQDGLLQAKILLVGRLLFSDNPMVTDYSKGLRWAEDVIPELESDDNIEYSKNLAMFYLLGIGVDKNISKSVCLFRKLASRGDKFSIEKLDQLGDYADVNCTNESGN